MEIRVLSPTNEIIAMRVDEIATCYHIKKIIADRAKCRFSDIHIFYNKRELQNNETICTLSLPKDALLIATHHIKSQENYHINLQLTKPKDNTPKIENKKIETPVAQPKPTIDTQQNTDNINNAEEVEPPTQEIKQTPEVPDITTDNTQETKPNEIKMEPVQDIPVEHIEQPLETDITTKKLIRIVNKINQELINYRRQFFTGDIYDYLDSICEQYTKPSHKEEKHTEDIIKLPVAKSKRWSQEEEEVLATKYAELGSDWNAIAEFIPGRTASAIMQHFQIHSKYLFTLKPKQAQTAPGKSSANPDIQFDPNDEPKLFEAWKIYGDDWESISCVLPQYPVDFIADYWDEKLYSKYLFEGLIPVPEDTVFEYRTSKESSKTTQQSIYDNSQFIAQQKPSKEVSEENISEPRYAPNQRSLLWTPEEEKIVIEMKNKGASFDDIAEVLKTRTASTIATRWYSKLMKQNDISGDESDQILESSSNDDIEDPLDDVDPASKRQWTEAEDEMLLKLYNEYHSDWEKINSFFTNRTPSACRMHCYLIRHKSSSSSSLSSLQTRRSAISHSQSASTLGGQLANASDDDYNEKKNADAFRRTYNTWSDEDDRKIIDAINKGLGWKEIYAMFPDRKETSVRTHCQCTLKLKVKNANPADRKPPGRKRRVNKTAQFLAAANAIQKHQQQLQQPQT